MDTNQELRAALTDALERPELDGALGERWVRALRRGFEARAAVPTQQTLQAAGALALADALAEHDVTPSAP